MCAGRTVEVVTSSVPDDADAHFAHRLTCARDFLPTVWLASGGAANLT
jgi:hypothetical protein